MDVSRTLNAVRLLVLAAVAAILWFVLSFFLGSGSASANEPSPLDPVGSLLGAVTEPIAPVVAAPVQVVAPVVTAVVPVAAPVAAPVVQAVAPVAAPVVAAVAPVTAPVVAAVAPVTAAVTPVVAPIVTPIAPVLAPLTPIVDALAPVTGPLAGTPVGPVLVGPLLVGPVLGGPAVQPAQLAVDSVLADVAASLGLTVSVPQTDDAAHATTAGAASQLANYAEPVSSVGLESAPGLPTEAPLPAAPTALSGSAVSGAAGPSPVSADVVHAFDLAAALSVAVSTLFDDELPSSPTFPSDTTPD